MDRRLQNMLNSEYIRVKELGNDIVSLNFTRNAFQDGIWNDETIKARGLFINKITGDIVARSYNKFFQYDETPETKEYVDNHLVYPLYISKKFNGFLGIISVYDDEFFVATKSTNEGEYCEYFKEILNKTIFATEEDKNELFTMLKERNCTATFEVMDMVNDQHIVYEENPLALLDFIPNTLDINGIDKDVELSETLKNKLNIKSIVIAKNKVINTKEELDNFLAMTEEEELEGAVITDSNGFMWKYKTNFYSFWKTERNQLKRILRNKEPRGVDRLNSLEAQERENGFMQFLKEFTKGKTGEELQELLSTKSIIWFREQYRKRKR
jgi:2',3'-cyclic-nucleotide 3'-phosphodiesterase